MNPNEKAFWNSTLSACNPSWSISVQNPTAALAEQNVFIYVVNTATGQIGAAAITEAAFTGTHERFEHKKEEIFNIAPGCVADLGEESTEELKNQCFLMAAAAISQSSTYEMVLDRLGHLYGHWIYIYYQLRDGSHLGRPVYVGGSNPVGSKFMETEALRDVLKRMIKQDTGSNESSVSKMISGSGGAVISDLLRI